MKRFINALIGLLSLLYPLAVYWGLQSLGPRWIAAMLAGLLLIRLLMLGQHWSRPLWLCGLAYAGFAAWHDQALSLLFYPVVVNAVLLLIFAGSLRYPPSLIERIARLQQPDLPPQGVIYTRRVTQVWCGFFVVNGGLALATALYCRFEVWSLYNGLIAYLLMGLLFAGEYVIRRRSQQPG